MKRDGKRALAAMTIAASAVLASGCAASASHTSVPTASRSPSAQPTPSNSRTAPAGQTPKQRAESDAASILASFVVPPGAVRLSAAPSVAGGLFKQPDALPGSPDQVDDAAWWQVPGGPQAVLAWEKAHLSRRFSDSGSGSGNNGSVVYWSDSFGLPAITGVLNSRALGVEAADVGGGMTDLRVDAQVTWIPARPASEVVPSAARAVTLSVLPNINEHTKPPGPLTITDPAVVRALAALIDGLPEFPPGFYSCPADFGDALVLTFGARKDGPALAVATIGLSGCEEVSFTIGGKKQPALAGPGGGQPVAAKALKIAGLHWQLPGFA